MANPFISFTGRTHGKIDGYLVNTIDYLEYPGKTIENVRDNLFGPLILADLCVKNKIFSAKVMAICNDLKNILNYLFFFGL